MEQDLNGVCPLTMTSACFLSVKTLVNEFNQRSEKCKNKGKQSKETK